ncbi:MAG TPA: PIN domain-containing protein [Thermodesulfobacteriota bacterium]|nr:PIN domain-containing protein [Thermodesulfobacteriota bacterium]
MPPILIDTNLLIYLYDPNQPDKQKQSERILEQLELTPSGRLSVQALAEFFSVATRKLSPSLTSAQALDQVTLFTRLWPVFDLTPMIVMEAGRGVRDHKLSYYDAQVWATARLNQLSVVFSEDFRDGSILEGVRFVNPFSPKFLLEKWL